MALWTLGVDLGTTFTAAALGRDGQVEMLGLGGNSEAIPSVLALVGGGEFVIGDDAERRVVMEPDRVVREFKRRIGDPAPILVGGTPFGAEALQATLLREVVARATEMESSAPDRIVVTHPANWGPYKRELLTETIRGAGLDASEVATLTEPEAAAAHYASQERIDDGERIAVYDLGGGTFDAVVLERADGRYAVVGSPSGVERLGGIDFDEAVVQFVREQIDETEVDTSDPIAVEAGWAALRRSCVAAKEALSTAAEAEVPIGLPGLRTSVRITRSEFEEKIEPTVRISTDALLRTIESAGIEASDLKSVLLVGGSSRIPLIGRAVSEALDRPVTIDAHPKFATAKGAAIAALDEPAPDRATPPAVPPDETTDPPEETTDRSRWLRFAAIGGVAAAALLLIMFLALGGDDGDDPSDAAAAAGEPSDAPADAAQPSVSSADGVLVADEPTRFFEHDWTVLGVERRPDGPDDSGADLDPSEDFVYVDLEITNPLDEAEFGIPVDLVTLVVDGTGFRPTEARATESGDSLNRIEVSPNRTDAVTVVFAIDAETTLEEGFIELDQPEYLPAAMAGPQFVDQSERVTAPFENTTYSGPFSRDAAEVEVLDSFWSRELGAEDDGVLIESPDFSSRRPPLDHVWLIVHFELTCQSTGIDTGGCNLQGGQVVVDGDRTNGSTLNEGVDYGETADFWAAYPVPVDATEVIVEISDGRTADSGAKTSFVVDDLQLLTTMATADG